MGYNYKKTIPTILPFVGELSEAARLPSCASGVADVFWASGRLE